jgi:SAM-dependent methyltransferase
MSSFARGVTHSCKVAPRLRAWASQRVARQSSIVPKNDQGVRAVRLDALYYRFAYGSGTPFWDSDEPRLEVVELAGSRPPGRALDLGCGTGSNCLHLASLGWEAVGVDFTSKAIATAKSRAAASGSSASFVVGDVTRLREDGITGSFDLVVDIGCYHAIAASLRDAYRTEVAAVTRAGGDLYVAGISDPPATWRLLGASAGVSAGEMTQRFGADFDLVDQRQVAPPARPPKRFIGRAVPLLLFHLVRKGPATADDRFANVASAGDRKEAARDAGHES